MCPPFLDIAIFVVSSLLFVIEKSYDGIVAFSEYPKFDISFIFSFPINSSAFCFACSSSISSPVNPFYVVVFVVELIFDTIGSSNSLLHE